MAPSSEPVSLFVDPDTVALRSLALEQLWREHMLAQLAVDAGVTSRAVFVAIGPKLNRRVQAAFRCYANELIPDSDLADDRVRFRPITLETLVDAIHQAGAVDLAKKLWARYLDFERVFHLAMAEYMQPDPSTDDPTEPSRASLSSTRTRKSRNGSRGNDKVTDASVTS